MLRKYAIINCIDKTVVYSENEATLGFDLEKEMSKYTLLEKVVPIVVKSYNHNKVYVIKERVGE